MVAVKKSLVRGLTWKVLPGSLTAVVWKGLAVMEDPTLNPNGNPGGNAGADMNAGLNPLSDDDVKALATSLEDERKIMEENEADQARRIFVQYSPVAATTICRMATNAASERMRFQAATYVVDRALGRLQDAATPPPNSPLDILMKQITREIPEDELEKMRQRVQGSGDQPNGGSDGK